jgi:predicted amidohydrolase
LSGSYVYGNVPNSPCYGHSFQEPDMQIVAVQLDSVWEDKLASQARVRWLLQSADIASDALIILPEMFDTGFSMNVAVTAQSDSRESEVFLRELAKEFDSAVLGGVVGPIMNGQASNEAVCFAPDGSELVRYRKMQPFTLADEHVHYGAGDSHQIFEWRGVQIAPFVCYDLRFPEVFRPAARDGAELIAVIACWPEARSEHWVRLLQARSIENQAFTVGVNRCGTDPQFRYDGRSTAFDPHGNQLFEANANEQLLTCEIDANDVKTWRETFPAIQDMRG